LFPYRADPPDRTAPIRQYPALGWPGDGVTRQETWWLMEHGPTLADWWESVMHGRQPPGEPTAPKMLKDLASPPPGIRGRSRDKIADFPQADEDKRQYYGMGAFPMDTLDGATPLAVYEHRSFADHAEVKSLEPLTMATWASIVQVFHKRFVPRS